MEVNDIWLMAKKAIISCSHSNIMNVRSLNMATFDHTKIKVEFPVANEELISFDIFEGKCLPTDFCCFVGSNQGRLYYMSKKWVSFEMELLNEVSDKAPMT